MNGHSLTHSNGFLHMILKFSIEDNLLTGLIPSQFGKLKRLREINFREYIIPMLEISMEIVHILSHISFLCIHDAGGNRLRGTIPPELGKLPKLELLNLGKPYVFILWNRTINIYRASDT